MSTASASLIDSPALACGDALARDGTMVRPVLSVFPPNIGSKPPHEPEYWRRKSELMTTALGSTDFDDLERSQREIGVRETARRYVGLKKLLLF